MVDRLAVRGPWRRRQRDRMDGAGLRRRFERDCVSRCRPNGSPAAWRRAIRPCVGAGRTEMSDAAAPSSADVTTLLVRWSQGDSSALDALIGLIYEDCREIAARQMRRERAGHTLDPTALVHELYLRLVDQTRANWENRAQFFAVAARLMRRILVDHARARHRAKRGGSATFVSLAAAGEEPDDARAGDVLAIDEALERLSAIDQDQVR